MNIRQFISEAYTEGTRHGAWLDLLAEIGLSSDQSGNGLDGYANAVLNGGGNGVQVARLTAESQTLSPHPLRGRLPLLLLVLNDAAVIETADAEISIPAGSLVALPPAGPWQLSCPNGVRMVALSVAEDFFNGRRTGFGGLAEPRVFAPAGLGAVICRTLEAAAEEMDHLPPGDWDAVEHSLAELYLTVLTQTGGHAGSDAPGLAAAALLHRITRTIEHRLADPELTAARVARLEGISERYLQKLFEGTGESFSLYLRERRLQSARATLMSPADVRVPVAEVAYDCGFNDAANFNRLFKERFGLSPGAFRKKHAEGLDAGSGVEQRGWPEQALTGKRLRSPRVIVEENGAGPGVVATDTWDDAADHHLPVDAAHVHWGYFSHKLRPVLEVNSGETVTVETLTQHASDDPELMIRGDAAAENVFDWTPDHKAVDRRGAGPMDASIFGRGAGEGFGVHICTGPIAIRGAEPGDVVEVRILDVSPRPSRSPGHEGHFFGSSAAAWWGYHYSELVEDPKPRENITLYEIFPDAAEPYATALYSYRWETQTDPFGTEHKTYDYPGVPVSKDRIDPVAQVLRGVKIPLRPHFGVIALAPREAALVDSVPPAYFGGNLDNWRLGRNSAIYLPVSVPGGLLSIGDPHAAQGDGELAGTAIECSMTGTFQLVLHKKGNLDGQFFADLTYPLIETPDEWVLTGFSHPNYLAEFGATGQSQVYAKSSLDLAMKDAFRKARRFLMATQNLSEDEAIALMSAAVDFGVTQVVDGNWGVHAIIRKSLFRDRNPNV
ncbi:acetamidase/formamidase family protein [uncultured Roseibium sp.]|uniref:acetamidase/formamidase family protein n=1 Tax=uncultured Roseibium sp. TaxID=1936171 RepID=UPI0032164CC2